MSWKTALRERCLADATISGLIGRGPGGYPSISWTERPQRSGYPALVLTTVSDGRPRHMTGLIGYRASRVQGDCYGTTQAEAEALADAVVTLLSDGDTVDGTEFRAAIIESVRDLGFDGDTGFVHRQSFDMILWHD